MEQKPHFRWTAGRLAVALLGTAVGLIATSLHLVLGEVEDPLSIAFRLASICGFTALIVYYHFAGMRLLRERQRETRSDASR
ncbi:hypothetical protein [Asanoa siamensis]|uniref:Uncharacterized protein n=1 Tax=Asanoa siamensis TaxID=926357 RepID=A0ABQ4CWK3_9ACTN|nr:hypothetical protein [Asanoa siamensis]GIF75676.1 hypothetical protein Asi02nite_51940 [Asanoa siamensis]